MYPLIISYAILLLLLFFAGTSFYLNSQNKKLKKKLTEKESIQKQRLYQISILKAIQERIGYSLDVENVIDTLTGSLKNLFTYSTASSVVLREDKIILKTYIEEKVNPLFLEEVKKSMLASISTLSDKPVPTTIEEFKIGLLPDETDNQSLASFFHVPLMIDGNVVGLINLSSKEPGLYKESDMTILYQMTNQASQALSRLKELLAIEEAKLVAMISSLGDGILMLDSHNNVTIINQSAKKLLDIHKEDVSLIEIIRTFPKTYNLSEKLQESITLKKTITEKEIAIGNQFVQLFITPVIGKIQDQKNYESKETIIGVTVLLHDITLEKSLAEMKQIFTSSIVHELRSPLTAIKSAIELIESQENLTEEQKRFLTIIKKQAKQMLEEIGTLLDAAKVEAGRFNILQKAYDITDSIKEQVMLFIPQAENQHIKVITDIENHLPKAYVDPSRISQVLNNLLSNSLKYTHESGSINIKAKMLWDHTTPQTKMNPCILISVADNGSGIAKDKQENLFSKYTQAEINKNGTGLGLYISKGIVEAHGGKISLQSEPNRGTIISFTVPIAKGEHIEEETKQFVPFLN